MSWVKIFIPLHEVEVVMDGERSADPGKINLTSSLSIISPSPHRHHTVTTPHHTSPDLSCTTSTPPQPRITITSGDNGVSCSDGGSGSGSGSGSGGSLRF